MTKRQCLVEGGRWLNGVCVRVEKVKVTVGRGAGCRRVEYTIGRKRIPIAVRRALVRAATRRKR